MFAFMKIASLLRAAQAALAGRNFKAAAMTAADLFDALGSPETATKIRGEIEAVGDGDARGIAVNALGLIAGALSAGFGWSVPITVSALPGADAPTPESALAHQLGGLADKCDLADAPKAMAAPDAAKAIPPELWMALIQGAIALITAIWQRRHPAA